MKRSAITFESARKVARAIPGIEEGTSWGTASLTVNGRMLACMAIHRSAEPGSLVVHLPTAQRDELIAVDPDTYYITEHYEPHASLLVRLSRIHPDALRDLLRMAARELASKPKPRRR